jgi:hypothetical protein
MDYRNRYMLAVAKSNAPEKTHIDVMGFVAELHKTQLEMMDVAVDYSDMQQAKDVINYIKNL